MCTCFYLLHHIDMHEKKGQSYSNYRIVYDIKKENSGNENYYIFFSNDCLCYCFQQYTMNRL